ncbi:peptidoglycan D,D-transpeptidase FtsI family protein [Wolbachia endosymbiont of Ctenocephalides felis wCfeJ]|uniref:peptidoglycan D,D-transpeptidase FtsI family protein n=1 Tax=Wolbachia endosymbiont of Ctenocephalides felis wCfeJ TaxID=2732594 RepID=UPI0014456A4D|nr:penicillin-binding protein 2 [Wolbachia endosymbiont of Ctenocephalides felis wCfeJ]WCR58026.1 MAG: putative peptidoglycan D,D-transpeptidase FtsI [Wolbachia endosymbiont of Ctenocephalides felis wCfeJ]
MQALLKNKLRSLYFIVPLFIFYIIIIFRIFSLTFDQSSALEDLKKSTKACRQPDILDRNGVVIATNVPTTSLYIDSTKVKNPESIAVQLSSTLDDLEYEDLYKILTSKRKFAWIKRHLTPKELLTIKNAGVPGVNFHNDVKRIYPHSNLFSHVLGYTDIDGNGIAGIETYVSRNRQPSITQITNTHLHESCNLKTFPAQQSPIQQTMSSQCLTLGSRYGNTNELCGKQQTPETYVKNNTHNEIAHKAGFQCHSTGMIPDGCVQLSLDLRVQSVVHEELANAVSKFQALGGVGIVLNVKNSEIIAMVSLPDFNPNLQNKAKDTQKFNRASLGVYEMGSIFKFFTIAAALDANVVKTSDLYDVSKPITIGEYKIRDLHKFKTPKITVRDIFVQSSNIGAAKVAAKLGIEKQVEYFKTMKLFSPLKIEIPEKSAPIIPNRWSESTLITASYGYGIAVTPMHIAQTAAALINNGIFHNATLVLNKRSIGEQIVTRSTSREIKKLLRATVTDGTGRKANIKAYSIGGKTGSAEKVVNGKYSKDLNIASFIGVLTILDPRYIVLIIIDEPQGMYHTGGMIATPVARNIMNKIAPILSVTPEM